MQKLLVAIVCSFACCSGAAWQQRHLLVLSSSLVPINIPYQIVYDELVILMGGKQVSLNVPEGGEPQVGEEDPEGPCTPI